MPANPARQVSRNLHKIRSRLIALAIIFPALYIGLALTFTLRDYRAVMQQAGVSARSAAAALNGNANRIIGEADALLQGASEDILQAGLSTKPEDSRALHVLLQTYARRMPQAIMINAVSVDGQMVANSASYPFIAIDVHDRDYFQAQRDGHGEALHIGHVLKSRLSDKWVFTVSRRVENPDGSMRMLLTVGIAVDYFESFYRTLDTDKDGHLWLVHKDGSVLMENPVLEKFLMTNVRDSELFRNLAKAPSGYFHVANAASDHVARIVGYISSNTYPVVAVASFRVDEVLSPWYERIEQTTLIGVTSIALMLILIAVLWRQLNQLTGTQERLDNKTESLTQAEQRFQGLVDGIDGVVWEAELPSLRFTYVSANAARITGYAADLWLSDVTFWQEKLGISPIQTSRLAAPNDEVQNQALEPIDHKVTPPQGTDIWLRSNVALTGDRDGVRRLRGVTVDVTSQRLSEQRLFQLAHFDTLTNLPNRQTFSERIKHAIALASRRNFRLAVMFLDVDHFKTINDSLGHEVGDMVLRIVADRISSCLRESDTVARIGGDEFVILLEEGMGPGESFDVVADKLTKAMAAPIMVKNIELYVAASMGICVFPQDGMDSETLLRNADTAMYRAKAAGRNCWRFFDESMARSAARKLELETALRRAVERGELTLHYQPQRALESDLIVGAEALIRWNRQGLGLVPPLEFIPLAEESGLIVSIGNWVLETACMQAAAWHREGKRHLRIAVNISARQIHHKDFVAQIARTLTACRLPAELLELEITESSILENLDETVRKLQQLKMMGVNIAIDDFGTGYSSLSYLKQLPIDRLKIDRTFVKDVPEDRDDCAIVRTIIAMADSLGLSVIAEGVETQEQLDFLKGEGCREVQGYLIAKPLPVDEFSALLAS
jgi:diguanylate cyclase (GGDEF)-like protein